MEHGAWKKGMRYGVWGVGYVAAGFRFPKKLWEGGKGFEEGFDPEYSFAVGFIEQEMLEIA